MASPSTSPSPFNFLKMKVSKAAYESERLEELEDFRRYRRTKLDSRSSPSLSDAPNDDSAYFSDDDNESVFSSSSSSSSSPTSSEEEEEEDTPDPWMIYPVDVVSFEEHLKGKRIYTRRLFEKFATLRDIALLGEEYPLTARDLNGDLRKVWEPNPPQSRYDKEKGEEEVENVVSLRFLTYPELSPDFQPSEVSDNVTLLRSYNKSSYHRTSEDEERNEHIPIPILLYSSQKLISKAHLNPGTVSWWNRKLSSIKRLWMASESCHTIETMFEEAAPHTRRITKIVCFGLGALNYSARGSYQECLQHMTALTIASTLNAVYEGMAKQGEKVKPVQIILQDPGYVALDRLLWSSSGYPCIRFVQSPDGFLAIDSNTLVLSAFLPITVPLMQICADLVPGGPAGFICDGMDLREGKKMFRVCERATPRVRDMLVGGGYRRRGFDDVRVEWEIFEECCGRIGLWLWKMECWLKIGEGEVGRK